MESKELAMQIAKLLDSKKATRVKVLKVRRMGEVDAVGGGDANAPADAQQAAQQANAASVQQPAA